MNIGITDLKRFFDTDDNKVSMPEFREFWGSLTSVEKTEYKRQLASWAEENPEEAKKVIKALGAVTG